MTPPIFYGAVHIFFYRNEDEVLMLKRQNTGYEDGKWSVVAGRIDGGEEVIAAAIREAREESGVHIEPSDIEIIGISHRKNTTSEWIDFFLKARAWSGEIKNAEPNKCEELKWLSLHDLPKHTIPYIKRALLNSQQGIWFDSVGW